MRNVARVFLLVGALVLPSRVGAQQLPDDFAAYVALGFTPVGGLAPMVTPTISGIPLRSVAISGRYGRLSETDGALNNFVASVLLPVSTAASVTLNAGVRNQTFEDGSDSQNDLILSVAGDMMLAQGPFGAGGSRYTFGLNGELGYGKAPGTSSIWAGSVGVPVALVTGTGPMKFVPFLTPAFGFGTINSDDPGSKGSGSRFMLGGGIGLEQLTPNLSVSAGFQKIFIEDGKTIFGLSVTLGGR